MAGNINSEKEHKFCLPFMECVLVPLPLLPETVKNEAFGCRLVGTAHMGVLWQFQMKVSRGEKSHFGGLFTIFFQND